MTFELYKLPYAENALAPSLSKNTLYYHYEKHHAGYLNTLNELIKGTPLEKKKIEEIVRMTADKNEWQKIFNNAAQIVNHTLYWQSLTPTPVPDIEDEELKQTVKRDFVSLDNLKSALKKAALDRFGSGWVWLIFDAGHLKVTTTANADTPMAHKKQILLTIDVWEHAYYLDYQNRRADYVEAVVEKLLNWNFAIQNFHKI